MKVTLIGTGPGDSGLLTLSALEELKNADVVLYDRLVGEEIIGMAPDKAEKIYVGKNSNNHPIPQHEINNIILDRALRGLNVVRLKGGDPYVFGRGAEEIEALLEHEIDFEVIPGVTSAVAAGTFAGIPVTHRDYSSSFTVVTGHAKGNGELNIDFGSLVRLDGTIVFMMSVSTATEIQNGLLAAGIEKNMPAAIIENATTCRQRKFITTAENLSNTVAQNNVTSPAVVIVGRVCGLSDKLDFFSRRPLSGKKIIVTRADNTSFARKLKLLGAQVIEMPCIKIDPLEVKLPALTEYSWVAFTSGVGVNLFFDSLIENSVDIRKLHHLKIAAVGPETEKEIRKRGIFADYVPEKNNGEALARGLSKIICPGEKILLPRAKSGPEDILKIFEENNILYENLPIYNTLFAHTKVGLAEADYITFTSASTVAGFVNAAPGLDFTKLNAVCIGGKTAAAAREYGFKVEMPDEVTIDSMAEKLKELAKK